MHVAKGMRIEYAQDTERTLFSSTQSLSFYTWLDKSDCGTTHICSTHLFCAWSCKEALVAALLGAGGSAARAQPCGAEWACTQGLESHWAAPWWTGQQGAAPALMQGPGARLAPDPARVYPHRRLLQIGVVRSTLAPALLSPATVSALAGVLQLATQAGAAPATNAAAAGIQIANAAADAATVLASAGLQYVVQHLPATPSRDGGTKAPVQTLALGPGPALGPAAGGASASLAAPVPSDGSAGSGSSWLAGIGAPQAAPPDTTTVSAMADNSGGSKIATVLIALLPASCFVLLGAQVTA